MNSPYFIYMLECADSSFYIGTTDNIEKRFLAHLSGKGARYTRSHKPIKVVYKEEVSHKSTALRREYELKQLTHQEKVALTLL